MPIRGFFAYPSQPQLLSETIRNAQERINSGLANIQIVTWEDAHVVGKLVIEEICRSIDGAELFLADLTGINPNVMFELGYAVAQKKRIWIILDKTSASAKRDYEQLQILTGVGYAPYSNSHEISAAFFREAPYDDLTSIFDRSIAPSLTPGDTSTVLFLRSRYETEADRRLAEVVQKYQSRGLPATIDDPTEARVNPITWYGQKVYSATGVLAHLSSQRHEGWQLHNARHGFVCGLAHGLGKHLLMLAEEDYEVPFDYRGLLAKYSSTQECLAHASHFLDRAQLTFNQTRTPRDLYLAVQLATELKGLRLGEYVAENEADELNRYFVETAAYREALSGRHLVFVGRRGAGKTANLLEVSRELGRDKRNFVVSLRPVGYDLNAIVRLLRKYRERDAKGYLVESLWKFLIYTEIANAAADAIETRLSAGLSAAEEEFTDFVRGEGLALRDDFAVRLERAIDALLPVGEQATVQATRAAISEMLHDRLLRKVRDLLSRVLHNRERVIVLVDNLDKAWERNGDLDQLSEFLLGLLSASVRIPLEFRKADFRRSPVNLGLAVFLRSDIFYHVTQAAREPDKIPYTKISWDDREQLIRVVERRFAASTGHPNGTDASEIWARYFCTTVRGTPTREYFANRVLPRPRDIVYLTRSAVATAVNRGHYRVEEDDVLEADRQYSQYALETVEVEGGVTLSRVQDVLFEFLGATETITLDEIERSLERAGVAGAELQPVVDQLAALSFLGIEIRPGQYVFPGDEDERRKFAVLARKLTEATGSSPRYRIHPAFHSYLEITPIAP